MALALADALRALKPADAVTRKNTSANGSRVGVSRYVWRLQQRDTKWTGPDIAVGSGCSSGRSEDSGSEDGVDREVRFCTSAQVIGGGEEVVDFYAVKASKKPAKVKLDPSLPLFG
jgi:hypothetical protein